MLPPANLIHCPHASAEIPEDLRGCFLLSKAALEQELLFMTDRYTDELFSLPPELASCVRFPVSRLVVDPERFEDDASEPMARCGMGAVYTRTSDGKPLRSPPTEGERQALLDRFYRPHHGRLLEAVDASLAAHARCLILDAHSFPSRPLPYEECQDPRRPQICIGTDAFHTPRWLEQEAVRSFAAEGFEVAVDRPFSGAIVPLAHHRTTPAVHALMIEVNRALYMDEASGQRLVGMPRFQETLQRVLRGLIDRYNRAVA